ncbi:MAG TPA: glyceraldehyde 3-phosphate dehydrogenase NAD-binding domain-containing protein, partial [Spirochaetia bacterium]|nr:glyceraldehyde 3-phosphate dehydrogenase NAD-binding domain-containing protein [Spirochaetia bacterium]
VNIVAVNDLIPVSNLAYLLKFDTVYGRYGHSVETGDNELIVDGKKIPVLSVKDPGDLPWKQMDVDTVIESTGVFDKREDLVKHIEAGAAHVILSAPAKSSDIETVVHGVNNAEKSDVISCASCTTNCITPVVEVMNRRIGVEKAMLTTVHSYTSTQGIVDSPSKKLRRGRAAAANQVPTSTGAAVATTKALPELSGKFDGVAIRVPTPVGSISDIVFLTSRDTSEEEITSIFEEEAGSDRYRNILGVSHEELVSSDIIGDARASIVDLGMTRVVGGNLVKIMAWYDNEWGYANQLVRELTSMKG